MAQPWAVDGHVGRYVTVAAGGDGRPWEPTPVDATWRDLAELPLHDGPACVDFVRRRGDPADMLGRSYGDVKGVALPLSATAANGRQPPPQQRITEVSTHLWRPLQQALQAAATAWLPPDADGISVPTPDRQRRHEAMRFLAIAAATAALADLKIGYDPAEPGPIDIASTFAAFLVMRAWNALATPRPLRHCERCGSWFEVRRLQRMPRFCSSTCRSLHFQSLSGGRKPSPRRQSPPAFVRADI